ncbi:MAG TPA: TIGR03564 family F420-dependent LLM class oxidoreductase [Acidimicrobiales bacterium]|nr:TIGR03564 family F420-dependent LLM class oxidoreductase [Acidimicrobiales bacterium]
MSGPRDPMAPLASPPVEPGSLTISAWAGSDLCTVDEVVATVERLAGAGFDGVWLPQTLSVDALTALAVAARQVPRIHVGTAVVPIQGRHPIPMAQQALTVAQAAGPGRFTLGIGVTHAPVSEGFYGIPYSGVVALCREQLEVLAALLGPDRRSDHDGTRLTARAPVTIDTPAPSVVVAALGPKMLDLAGMLADGTVTWMTGPATLAATVIPVLGAAAERAGRPAPRVIAGLPVCVTREVDAARDAIRPRIEGAGQMASYGRQLRHEGLDDVADLAIVGDAAEVADRVRSLTGIGVTELMADVFGTPDEREATTALLTSLAGGAG